MYVQDFRRLQEAYLEVYNNLDLDEELTGERKEKAAAIAAQKTKTDAAGRKKRDQARWLSGRSSIGKEHPSQGFGSHPDPEKSRAPKNTIANHKSSPGVKKKNISRMGAGRLNWKTGKENVAGHGMPQVDTLPRGKGSKAARRAAALNKEEVDIYDIILSHLLDEGYAETPEAAKAIMVNMSEEWREGILDEMQYITPPQPSAIVRPAPSKINRTPSKINQKGREINQQSSKGSGMATQALVGLGAAGAVAASGKGEKRKYRM